MRKIIAATGLWARTLVQRALKLRKRSRKWVRRMRDPARRSATAWCKRHGDRLADYAIEVDGTIWRESVEAKKRISELRRARLSDLRLHGAQAGDIGGGPANLALLYWLVRVLKPACVVETGVAGGASSRAILEAMKLNGMGVLFSSDLAGVIPREFSGVCVDREMRENWTLLHDGDRENIPVIKDRVGMIDLLHYDSAKDAHEMAWVVEQLRPKMSASGVLVLDDIDRHGFMRDFVVEKPRSWHVFGAVGVIGLDEALAGRR